MALGGVRLGDARPSNPVLEICAQDIEIPHREKPPGRTKIRLNVFRYRAITELCSASGVRAGKFVVSSNQMLDVSTGALVGSYGSRRGLDLHGSSSRLYSDRLRQDRSRAVDRDIARVMVDLDSSQIVEKYLRKESVGCLLRATRLTFVHFLDFPQNIHRIDIRLGIHHLVMAPA